MSRSASRPRSCFEVVLVRIVPLTFTHVLAKSNGTHCRTAQSTIAHAAAEPLKQVSSPVTSAFQHQIIVRQGPLLDFVPVTDSVSKSQRNLATTVRHVTEQSPIGLNSVTVPPLHASLLLQLLPGRTIVCVSQSHIDVLSLLFLPNLPALVALREALRVACAAAALLLCCWTRACASRCIREVACTMHHVMSRSHASGAFSMMQTR